MHNYTPILWFVVPQPEVIPIVRDDGSAETTSLDYYFTLSFLINVDPAVDTPVEVEAVWSGNPSLSDSPRVAVKPVPLRKPYLTSIEFASIVPRDLGEYNLTVRAGTRSTVDILDSLEVRHTASISEYRHILILYIECYKKKQGCRVLPKEIPGYIGGPWLYTKLILGALHRVSRILSILRYSGSSKVILHSYPLTYSVSGILNILGYPGSSQVVPHSLVLRLLPPSAQ